MNKPVISKGLPQVPRLEDRELEQFLVVLKFVLEEMESILALPDGESRNLLAYRASGTAQQTGWRAYHADTFGYCDETSVDELLEG